MSATQDLFLSACTGESSVERELRRDLNGTALQFTELKEAVRLTRADLREILAHPEYSPERVRAIVQGILEERL